MTDMENFHTIWSLMIRTGHHLGPVDRESGARCTEIAMLKKEEAAVQFRRRRLLNPTFFWWYEFVENPRHYNRIELLLRLNDAWDLSDDEED